MEIGAEILYILFFVLTVFLTSKPFSYLYTKQITRKTGKKYSFTEDDIHYSFDPLAYLYNQSMIPIVKSLDKESIAIEPDYSSILFARFRGLMIYAGKDKKKELIGYFPFESIGCPLLDKLKKENKINQNIYSAIIQYKLLQKDTHAEIIDEVYTHIKNISVNKFF